MDFTVRPIIKKMLFAFALAVYIPLACFWFYVTYADFLTAKLSLYNAGIKTTELWRTDTVSFYCGQTPSGQWIAVEDQLIVQGAVAEDACIESQRVWVTY